MRKILIGLLLVSMASCGDKSDGIKVTAVASTTTEHDTVNVDVVVSGNGNLVIGRMGGGSITQSCNGEGKKCRTTITKDGQGQVWVNGNLVQKTAASGNSASSTTIIEVK